MSTATLGGLIKDYRIKKRLSQLEVSLRIGWQDTSRLSKIEQGRVGKPTRETVEKIIKALELDQQEKGEFLFIGGYLPTEEEIINIRKKLSPIVSNWSYPAAIFDFSWRAIDQNKANIDVYQISSELNHRIFNEHLRVLEILFDPNLKQNKFLKGNHLKGWYSFLSSVIVNFKYEQKKRVKEKWYIYHLKDMLLNPTFRKLWSETEEKSGTEFIIGRFAKQSLINPKKFKERLNFYLFTMPVLEDPRFALELLVPMDMNTYQYYQNN